MSVDAFTSSTIKVSQNLCSIESKFLRPENVEFAVRMGYFRKNPPDFKRRKCNSCAPDRASHPISPATRTEGKVSIRSLNFFSIYSNTHQFLPSAPSRLFHRTNCIPSLSIYKRTHKLHHRVRSRRILVPQSRSLVR